MPLRAAVLPVMAVLAVAAIATAACTGSAATPPAAPAHGPAPDLTNAHYADWPTYHGSASRHGYAASMPAVRGKLRVVKQLRLDGAVYASPIVIHGTTIVATENDTVYAFGPKLHQLWKQHLGSPSPQSQRPCGDIDPLGITGTPVYDPQHGTVFVAPELSGTPPTHQLVALNFRTGHVKWRRTLDLKGVDSAAMQERGALALDGARVFVPFGGLAGDCGQYKGRVVGRLRTTGRQAVEFTVPTAREAGIWTPPGPTVDSAGHMFVSVGNGATEQTGPYDHSDSVLELSPRAKLLQSFSPTTWRVDNANDLDLGSQGPAIVGKWIFSDGKRGTAYVLRHGHLGGIGGAVSHRDIGASFGGTAVLGHDVFVPTTNGLVDARIGPRGRMQIRWRASEVTGSPVVGGGRVWSLDTNGGALHALGIARGRDLGSIAVGGVSRFATPAIYGPDLFVPTLSGLTVVATS